MIEAKLRGGPFGGQVVEVATVAIYRAPVFKRRPGGSPVPAEAVYRLEFVGPLEHGRDADGRPVMIFAGVEESEPAGELIGEAG